MNYAEARAIVTAPDYKPIKKQGAPLHPNHATYKGPKRGWGADYMKKKFYEDQLIDYIVYHFDVLPEAGEREKYTSEGK